MFQRILVLCTGNICRSPMAEGLLKASLQTGCEVRSAGTAALVGYPPADEAITVMRQHGHDVSQYRAQFVSPELLRWADLVLVMEPHHKEALQEIDATARGKTFLVGHWQGEQVIDDPVGQGTDAFEQAYAAIETAIGNWVNRLRLAEQSITRPPPSCLTRRTRSDPRLFEPSPQSSPNGRGG